MSTICQANLTKAQDIGYNWQNCRSYSFVLSELMGGRNEQSPLVHCAFSAANVNVEYRHELMLLATEQHYSLFPFGQGKLPTSLRETNKTRLII